MKKITIVCIAALFVQALCFSAGKGKLVVPSTTDGKVFIYGIVNPLNASVSGMEWTQTDSRKPVSYINTIKTSMTRTVYYGFCDLDTYYKLIYHEYITAKKVAKINITTKHIDGGLNKNSKFDFKTKKTSGIQYMGWRYADGDDMLSTNIKDKANGAIIIGALDPEKDADKIKEQETKFRISALKDLKKEIKEPCWVELIDKEIASLEKGE